MLLFGILAITCYRVTHGQVFRHLKQHTIEVDGRERTYRVVVPPNAEKPMPLVLVLHGGGFNERSAARFMRYTGFAQLGLDESFIAVFPVGVDGQWNDGRTFRADDENFKGVDDVKFIRTVIDEVSRNHPVDRTRVFSVGISNGGFMSHRLAADASDLITGIAPIVGGMSPEVGKTFDPEYPVSMFVIQGDADPLIPIDGGKVGFERGRNSRGEVLPTTDTIAKYLNHNQITGKPKVSMLDDVVPDDGTTAEATIYPTGVDGTKVQLYTIKNGGHTWPGKSGYLPESIIGKTCQDFDATEAIWEFFQSCPPRNLKP